MGVAAWNCLATLEHGDDAGDRYPVPTGDTRVVQPEPGEQGAPEWKFNEFSVHYHVNDTWNRTRFV